MKTYCLEANKGYLFSITSTDPSISGVPPRKPSTGAQELPGIKGKWPDGDFGSEVELRLEIDLYKIRIGPCEPPNETCKEIQTGILRDFEPVKSFKSDLEHRNLLGGKDLAKALAFEGAKVVGGAALGQVRLEDSDQKRSLIALHEETKRLKRELKNLKKRRLVLGE